MVDLFSIFKEEAVEASPDRGETRCIPPTTASENVVAAGTERRFP
jgi:hypothetical protein